MVEEPQSEILIGVDGGATEVRAYEVRAAQAFELGAASCARRHESTRGFRPVQVEEQLDAHARGAIDPDAAELAQGEAWIEDAALVILGVAREARASSARVALCMPGVKTADGRGIAVMKNGPRMPDFLDRLARILGKESPAVVPIGTLSSDGTAAAWGEEVEPRGLLRGVDNAYYLGGGTGLAEAFKLDGRIVGFDDPSLRDKLGLKMEKAWRLRTSRGVGFEEILSARGLNETWAARAGADVPRREGEFPEQRAARGDPVAIAVLREAAEALAELIAARSRAAPGGRLDRVVLGQRLGRLYADPGLHRLFRETCATAHGLVVASSLRAAPAIGAVAIALLAEPAAAPRAEKARTFRG